jgi:hypothetical protein
MRYVTRISHRRQKYKFGLTRPSALFVESILVPPEHGKWSVEVLCHGCTRMHYVTRRSYQMQKHKFGVTSPDTLFIESVSVAPEHEK